MIEAAADWEPAFGEWLKPFLEALGHKVRQRWAPVYVRGLLGPGERKSVQPIAARVAPADCDQLHHFISSPAWQTAPLAAVLAREADRLVGGPDAVLIIDDTALPKTGEHSVGVARQYGELPGPGLAHPGPRRGAGAAGAAALPAPGLVPGSAALRQSGGAGGLPRLPQQGGDRARRARPALRGRGPLRLRRGRRRLRQQRRLPARPRQPRPAL